MFPEIEAIAALGASIDLSYRAESYYSANEKWALSIQLTSEGAGIRVEFKAATMAACFTQAVAKFHTLRQKGFVAYQAQLPAPAPAPDTSEEEVPF